jgi:hypothetical protein
VWVGGSPWDFERATIKLDREGAKRAEETETPLTMSAFSLLQSMQMLSRMFFTLMMKPKNNVRPVQ